MKESKSAAPIWIPPELHTLFEKIFLSNPLVWNAKMCPQPRLFLLFGQSGSGMEDALEALSLKHNLKVREIRCSVLRERTKDEFNRELQDPQDDTDILVICNGHILPHMSDLAYLTLDLEANLKQLAKFIIVVSEEPPTSMEHIFWKQFQPDNRILMSTPNFETLLQLHKHYFEWWKTHWLHGKVELDDEAYENLVDASGFCTAEDVHTFAQRVFRHCIVQYPEQNCTITWEWLESNFCYHNSTVEGMLSISDRDPQRKQSQLESISGYKQAPASQKQAETKLNSAKRVRVSGTEPIPDVPVDIGV